MSKNKSIIYEDDNKHEVIIPEVDNERIEPKVKIYDPNDGGYWYRSIGLNRRITDEE